MYEREIHRILRTRDTCISFLCINLFTNTTNMRYIILGLIFIPWELGIFLLLSVL